MKHEIAMRLEIESPAAKERVIKQIEALFDAGTIRESIAAGLRLDTEPHLIGVIGVETAGPVAAAGPGPTFPVIIAVDVTSYCTIQLEADSDVAAAEIVARSIAEEGWESPFWQRAADWDTDWQNAADLRVI